MSIPSWRGWFDERLGVLILSQTEIQNLQSLLRQLKDGRRTVENARKRLSVQGPSNMKATVESGASCDCVEDGLILAWDGLKEAEVWLEVVLEGETE